MLTATQKALLDFICTSLDENDGVCPSYEEMMEALDLNSKSGVHRLVCALEERGYIRRLPNRARCLIVLRQSHGAVPPDRDSERERIADYVKILSDENKTLRAQVAHFQRRYAEELH